MWKIINCKEEKRRKLYCSMITTKQNKSIHENMEENEKLIHNNWFTNVLIDTIFQSHCKNRIIYTWIYLRNFILLHTSSDISFTCYVLLIQKPKKTKSLPFYFLHHTKDIVICYMRLLNNRALSHALLMAL